jgi:ribose transport system ATP-binding protein
MIGEAHMTKLLELRDASMTFGSTRALRHVSLAVGPGEVRALMGENGSGKSTLIKILAGFHTPEGGASLYLGGEEVDLPVSPAAHERVALNFVHQDLALITGMSIVDNFAAGRWRREHQTGLARVRWRSERRRARVALARFGLAVDVDTPIGALREGERAIVALARALSTTPEDVPSVLVLDEPTASLPRQEVAVLFDAVRTLQRGNHGVIFVSHRLDEVRAIADTATVLRDGELVLECRISDTDDDALVKAIVGHEVAVSRARAPRAAPSGLALSLTGASGNGVRDVSFDLHYGEAVGLTGLAGMGHDALPELLLGLATVDGGGVSFGDHGPFRSPRAALQGGVAYLPASRARGGCIMSATVAESITMPILERYFHRGRIDRRAERTDSARLLEAFDVRPRRPDTLMGSLSGGNQQKTLLARLDHSGARLLILHEPSHGVDVGAREQVLTAINRMKMSGRAVLVISNEYEDLERVCDRVLVFAYGEVRRVLTGDAVTEHDIAAACLQVTESVVKRPGAPAAEDELHRREAAEPEPLTRAGD